MAGDGWTTVGDLTAYPYDEQTPAPSAQREHRLTPREVTVINDLSPALAQRLVDQVGVSVAHNVNLVAGAIVNVAVDHES